MSFIVVLGALTTLALIVASAAPSVPAQPIEFTRANSTLTSGVGEVYSETRRIALPFISRDYCPASRMVISPFAIQIASLHEVVGGVEGTRLVRPVTEAEWLAMYEESFPGLLEALEDSGAGWARVRINWSWIQPEPPPADYVWGPYHDEKLRLVAETGVRLIATVGDAPAWAAESPCAPIYPDRLDEFAQFLTDLVGRYRQFPYKIKHWELINEPDGTWPNGWVGGLGCWGYDGEHYAQMLSVAYQAIQNVDPEATVLMGGVAYDWFTEHGGPFYRYFPDDVMAAGGGEVLDVLNFHYFPDFHAEWERWVPEGHAPTCGDVEDGVGTPYAVWGVDLIAKATHFRNRIHTCFGVDKPVWVTELAEHGYSGDPDSLAQQARYVIQGYARGLAAGVENITWYALTTLNDTYEQGLLFDDGTPKPAFYAYQMLASELAGHEYARTLDVEDVEGYVFENPCQQEKTVAWGSGSLTFAPAGILRVVDREANVMVVADGGAGDMDGMQNGTVELQLSAEPVFITVGQ